MGAQSVPVRSGYDSGVVRLGGRRKGLWCIKVSFLLCGNRTIMERHQIQIASEMEVRSPRGKKCLMPVILERSRE
jgi:hypothetical protein